MTYDYKCNNCNTVWQETYPINTKNPIDELDIHCPECKTKDVKRYLGNYRTATVVFKGMGWAHKELALDRIGMNPVTRNSPEAQAAMKKRL
jgi:predicted nucleic acid-binding Zn ribbon protein